MSEPTVEPTAPAPTEPVTGDDGKDWKAEAEKLKSLSRKWEERAKANAGAAAELEKIQAERMTEDEKSRAEAFEGGRAAARQAMTERLVAAEFRAAAALDGRDLDAVTELLEDLNVDRFIGDDGEPDTERIRKRVQALRTAGGQQQRQGNPGQGAGAPPPASPGAAGLAEAERRFARAKA